MESDRQVRRPGRWLMLAAPLVAMLAAGCGKEYVNFRPAESAETAASGWVGQGLFRLPPGVATVALSVEARGVIEKPKDGPKEESFQATFRAQNRGQETFTLDPAAAKLIDDDGRTLAGAKAYVGKNPTGALAIPGGGREEGVLVFPFPPGVRFDSIGSVKLVLPYRFGDKPFEATAKFVRIEEGYYDSYGGPPYPTYYPYYYSPYYYGPYYYPYGYPYGYPYDYGFYGGSFRFRGEHRGYGGRHH